MKTIVTMLVAAISVIALSDSAHAGGPQPFNWSDWENIEQSESHYVMPSGEIRFSDITYRVRRDDSNFGHRHENWYWRTGFIDFHKIGSGHYARREKKKGFVRNAKNWPRTKSDGVREMSSKDVRRGKNSFGRFWYILTSDPVQRCFFYFQQLTHRGKAGYEDALDAAGGFIAGVDCRSTDNVPASAYEKAMLHYVSGLRRRTPQDNKFAARQAERTVSLTDATARCERREGVVRSRHTQNPTQVEIMFVNNTNREIYAYWIDYQGNKQLRSSIKPGESAIQSTYLRHPWLISDGWGKCLDLVLPTEQPRTTVRLPTSTDQSRVR